MIFNFTILYLVSFLLLVFLFCITLVKTRRKKYKPLEISIFAWLDGESLITVKFEQEQYLDNIKTGKLFKIFDNNGYIFPVQKISTQKRNTSKIYTDLIYIELNSALDISELNLLKFKNFNPVPIIPREVLSLNKYFYDAYQLGALYRKNNTEFRLWTPTARKVNLLLFDYYNSDTSLYARKLPMKKIERGVWFLNIEDDLNGVYYLYEIELYDKGELVKNLVQDPYTKASGPDSTKSYIYDKTEVNKKVKGWNTDKFVKLSQNTDAIVYELHIRDYTISENSGVYKPHRGRYLGLTKENTVSPQKKSTGLDNIKELGITHVHILPTFDYGTGNEAEQNICYTWYNWGYDPVLYFTPEGSYATNPCGIKRHSEYKKMVKSFHKNNVGVIFDVVFNHTYQTGREDRLSLFDKIVPMYFYRVNNNGEYSNGSLCGNELATERPMVRKYILDNLKYWVEEYHIDGFRFDLMGLMDRKTMIEIRDELKKINPNIILLGEAWNMSCLLPENQKMNQQNLKDTNIAAFNDGIRNNLIGDVFHEGSKGFIQNNTPMTGLGRLKGQIRGDNTGGGDLIEVCTPNETVNYVNCHDNYCLYDKLSKTCPSLSNEKIKKMNMLAFAVIITSQGIPFFIEGEEFGRTKHFVENSYNWNDPLINPLNWNLKACNNHIFNFYKGLIKLRKEHPAFRMSYKNMIQEKLQFFDNLPEYLIAFILKDYANGDPWRYILVIFNSSANNRRIKFKGKWNIVVRGEKAGTDIIDSSEDILLIPGRSALIAYTDFDLVEKELSLIEE